MTKEELMSEITKYHSPKAAEQEGSVYQTWEDGEVTLQKCGSLLWQRTLHCLIPGKPNEVLTKDLMPVVEERHGYVFAASMEDAMHVRTMLLAYASTRSIKVDRILLDLANDIYKYLGSDAPLECHQKDIDTKIDHARHQIRELLS